MILKATQIFLLILVTSLTSYAQNNDYKIYRDSLTKLSCKPFDSLTVANTVNQLNQLDTNQFHKNLDLYYRDLGWAYYRLFLHNKDTSFIRLAVDNYIKQDNPEGDYWNIAFCYFKIKDCINGYSYLKKYKENTDIQYWQSEEAIKRLTAECDKLYKQDIFDSK